MKYFTRGWANGELGERASEQIVVDYQERLSVIEGRLSAPARTLAREVDLHDAVIERTRWVPSTSQLTMTLLTVEARAVQITYVGAMLGTQRIEALRAASRDREAVLLYAEVDLDDEGLLSHRLLFWPREELTIDCRELHVHTELRADRRVVLGAAFLVA